MAKHWLLYILECKDKTLYTGITDDLPRRLSAHRAGTGAKYTRGRSPLRVCYVEECENKSQALKRECYIKGLKKHQKMALCISNWKEHYDDL